jgi:putative glutathione S-transferase
VPPPNLSLSLSLPLSLLTRPPAPIHRRLFHTLVRFDPVYVVYFKCNKKRIQDYPNLLGFVRDVYSIEPVKRSINMKHIKTHYFTSHPSLNGHSIIPAGLGPDLDVPSGRGEPVKLA